jgi:hypothetical protein
MPQQRVLSDRSGLLRVRSTTLAIRIDVDDGRSKPLMIPLSSSLTQVMTKRDREATESRYGIAAILTELAHSQFLASQANRLICCRG